MIDPVTLTDSLGTQQIIHSQRVTKHAFLTNNEHEEEDPINLAISLIIYGCLHIYMIYSHHVTAMLLFVSHYSIVPLTIDQVITLFTPSPPHQSLQ